ncbi:hypothetical protein TSUD_231770 [Trifolium subterraneum]|uniref:Reverse transcriptase domain-containing protein n=1 Tax=Trifolium subterraneum TaxID=3900 RepID=A0A2Z6M0J8_TRISU|nr:hypothetical protein TSUD_231770 [Trifolium subterraneum]
MPNALRTSTSGPSSKAQSTRPRYTTPLRVYWNCSTSTTALHHRLVDSDQGKDQWRRLRKQSPNPPNHQNQSDGVETSVTPEGSAAHAQATPLNVPPPHQPPQPEDPLVVPQVPQGAPMEVVMAALVNTINRQGQILREQANNMRGQNELIREQNRRLRAVEESRVASRVSQSARRQRSPTPENDRSRSRSRSPRPAPRRNAERPVSPPRDIPRRQNHSPPRRNNHVSPPRNRRSPPRRNNRSPPRSGEAAARGGNARHSARRESPSRLEKPPMLDKYDGTTDPDEHVQSVETALDYRNLRGSIKCKLFPLSLVRGASTWWRNLPPGSIDSWEELCRMFTAHFTTSRRHPKTVASLKAIVQVELDARTSKKERKQEKKTGKDDLLIKENYRPIPDGEFELVPLGEDPTKGVKVGADLPDLVKRQLKACLKENVELFAWSAAEMPEINPEVACHQLTIDPRASDVVQRRRKQSPEKAEATRKAVKDLLEANFIAEAQYTTWLSNVVLVKKSNGKWRMCVDYTDLNRACPKDAYPLPNIDKLVDNSSGFKLLSFMDAYSGYNQIKMAEIDKKKTAFMTETGNYYYNVMSFGLKNAGATYQRMMNKVFHNEIGDMLEVYMDDMIVKSEEEIDHTVHLKRVFDQARKFNMRFNPEKCTFGVKAGKFLGFYLTERGIEANPDKCRAFFDYPTPKSKKSIQTLNGMLTSMARFVAKSAQHALPLFKLIRKETTFEWTEECEGALQHLKRALSEPPVLTRPVEGEKLYLYLTVASEVISAVLIRETEQGQLPKRINGPSSSMDPRIHKEVGRASYSKTGTGLAEDMGAEEIRIFTDSQLVASQVSGEYQTKEERLLEYLNLIRAKLAKFKETEVKHVPREHNARADVLSKLASTRRKKAGNQSLIQETLTKPSIEKTTEVMHICAVDEQSWMSPVYNFLKSNTLPVDAKEAAKIRKRACSYVLLDDKLYRRGFSIPLLKCVEEARVEFILQEIHEGINGQHIGGRSLARKALRAGQRAENANLPVALCLVGNGHPRSFPNSCEASQIPHCCRGLFHQMD